MNILAHKSLQEQLKRLLEDKERVRKLKFSDGKTVERYLLDAAEALKAYIAEEINSAVYGRKESGWYRRSGDFERALDDFLKIDPDTNTITIGFDSDAAWHDSWITKTRDPSYDKQAYVPMAILTGYRIFPREGVEVPFVPGINYIQDAIDKFKKSGKWKGITVDPDPYEPETVWWD